MYRLLEITYTNDKESVALYPTAEGESFADETALTAEFDTKMGAAIKADAYKVEYLLAFDDEGNIYAEGYDSKDNTIELSSRLAWVTKTAEGATANQSKENDMNVLRGDFYTKRGAAKKNADVKGILLLGFNGSAIEIKDNWNRPVEESEPNIEPQEQGE